MKLRQLRPLAAALGLAIGSSTFAAEPPAAMPAVKSTAAANQQLADTIAAKLTATGSAHLADVSLQVTDGVVTLLGTCRDAATKEKVIHDVRLVPGVTKVRDGLTVNAVIAVQGTQPQTLPPAIGPVASPTMMAMPPSAANPVIEPQAMGAMTGMGSAEMNAPPLPPYAWPTYAPYNNVSRVGYPTAYPYNAFPFIGPYYPFPKVPLGFRKITLEWEDGHWWYGRLQTPNDYWRVRFW